MPLEINVLCLMKAIEMLSRTIVNLNLYVVLESSPRTVFEFRGTMCFLDLVLYTCR